MINDSAINRELPYSLVVAIHPILEPTKPTGAGIMGQQQRIPKQSKPNVRAKLEWQLVSRNAD